MQTSFTDKQLQDKDNKTSETIIRKCVHCGMCNATCPTYQINGEELEGPRGRIYLIKDMLENKKPATKEITKHIDSCLSCYSCMTTCPSGVNYMHLIDHGRNYVEETYKRPFLDRLFRNILSFVLPKPKVFLLMALSSKLIKPFSFLFPKFIRNALNLMPDKIPGKKLKEQKVYEVKKGKKVSRVALLTGCVQRVISPEINDDIEIEINNADIRVDTYRASGAGGQHVNKTDSAVRLTHIPTGTVSQCQNGRSQHKNKENALKQLKSKLYELELQKQKEEQQKLEDSKADIGWGSQIRSYVLDQSRIKDLRTNYETGNTSAVLDGNIDEFMRASLKAGI